MKACLPLRMGQLLPHRLAAIFYIWTIPAVQHIQCSGVEVRRIITNVLIHKSRPTNNLFCVVIWLLRRGKKNASPIEEERERAIALPRGQLLLLLEASLGRATEMVKNNCERGGNKTKCKKRYSKMMVGRPKCQRSLMPGCRVEDGALRKATEARMNRAGDRATANSNSERLQESPSSVRNEITVGDCENEPAAQRDFWRE